MKFQNEPYVSTDLSCTGKAASVARLFPFITCHNLSLGDITLLAPKVTY